MHSRPTCIGPRALSNVVRHRTPLIVHPRCQLRMLQSSDASSLFRLVDANRQHLRQWLPWVDAQRGPAQSLQFIVQTHRECRDGKTVEYGIFVDCHLAGVISLLDIAWADTTGKLGYWIAEDVQGQGLVTQSCQTLMAFAFQAVGLHRLEIWCAAHHAKSVAVAQRLHFQREGTFRQAQWLHGRHVDRAVFGLVMDDWMKTGGAAAAPDREG